MLASASVLAREGLRAPRRRQPRPRAAHPLPRPFLVRDYHLGHGRPLRWRDRALGHLHGTCKASDRQQPLGLGGCARRDVLVRHAAHLLEDLDALARREREVAPVQQVSIAM